MFIFFCELVRDLSPRPTRLGGVGYKVVGVWVRERWWLLFLGRKRDSLMPICAPHTRYMHTRPRTQPSAKYALKGIVKIGFCPWIICGGGFGSFRDNVIFFSAPHPLLLRPKGVSNHNKTFSSYNNSNVPRRIYYTTNGSHSTCAVL